MNNSKLKILSAPYIIWIAAFIIVPLIIVFYYGLTNSAGSFTFENVAAIAKPEYVKALFLSILLAFLATVICLLLAYPLALILKSFNMNKSSFVIFIFVLPMWMNFLLRTYAWKTLLSRNGLFDVLFNINILNTTYAILLGMVYDFLPFMILPIYNILMKIEKDTIDAARDLGANYFQTLRKIIIPQSLPGIISGIIMVFVPSLTTFVISEILGGRKFLLIGDVIERQFMQTYNWNLGSGLSLVLMVFILLYMALTAKFDKSEGADLI